MKIGPCLVFASIAWLTSAAAWAGEEIVTIPTRDGVQDSYLLSADDSTPKKIIVVSFVGSEGAIELPARAAKPGFGFGPRSNFLIRIRRQMADAATVDAIVDAPSDRLPGGMSDIFRKSREHAADVRAVILDLKRRYPGAKVFLIGTSRGSISAAALGVSLHDIVDGIVLSSTLSVADRVGTGLSNFDFVELTVPVLMVHNVDDGCRSSPYAMAEQIATRYHYPLVTVSGGDPPESGPCDAASPHGFFGREAPTTQAIKQWMNGQEYAKTIP